MLGSHLSRKRHILYDVEDELYLRWCVVVGEETPHCTLLRCILSWVLHQLVVQDVVQPRGRG